MNNHPACDGVTLTGPENKDLEPNSISESISFPLLAALTQADSWAGGKISFFLL